MRTSIALTPFVPWLLALASCSSPPKPPTVDESQKRPVNSQMAVELQVCKNDLQNTRMLATESGRLAETTAATLANLAARQQILAAMQGPAGQQPQANSVFTVRFDFGSTRVVIPADVAATLVEDAKASPLVLLRGRTDGTSDAPGREPHRPGAGRRGARLPGGRGRGPGAHPRHLPAGRRPRGRQRQRRRARPEPPRRDRAVPRAAGRTERHRRRQP